MKPWILIGLVLILVGCTSYGTHDEAEYDRVYEVFERHMHEALMELGIPTPTPYAGVPSPSQQVLSIIGPTGAQLAFPVDTGAFLTTGNEHSFTWVGSPSFSTLDGIPVVTLNGTSQGAHSNDHPYWSPGNGITDDPFTISLWVKPAIGLPEGNIFGKYMISGPEIREWLIQFESADAIIGVIRDESSGGGYKPRWAGLPAKDTWWMLTLTYDGSGTIEGMEIWYQGQPVRNGETNYGNYTAMEDTAAPVALGYSWLDGQRFQFFEGDIAGGYCGPIFTKIELSQSDLQSLYALCSIHLN